MQRQHNILFVKLCCIGDILFLTPAIRSVRTRFPEARITLLASTWIKEIAERIPSVDDVIYFDAPMQKSSLFKRFTETLRTILTLRRRGFSSAVIAHRSSVFSIMMFAAGIKQRIGFTGAALLTENVPFEETKHETARYLDLTERLTGPSGQSVMELSASTQDTEFGEQFLRSNAVDPGTRLIGIFPGGGDNPGTRMHIKRWPGQRYAALVKRLYQEERLIPIFIGGAPDTDVAAAIIESIEGDIPFVNAVNKSNLGQLTGLLAQCTLVLGGDSGPMHMAAALGIPTVTIFGPSDPRLVAPIGPKHRYIWKQAECSPCYTPATVKDKKYFIGNDFICTTGTHICIKEISVDDVYRTIMETLHHTGEVKEGR